MSNTNQSQSSDEGVERRGAADGSATVAPPITRIYILYRQIWIVRRVQNNGGGGL